MSRNFIKLNDGRSLYCDYGKYRPNLTFVLDALVKALAKMGA